MSVLEQTASCTKQQHKACGLQCHPNTSKDLQPAESNDRCPVMGEAGKGKKQPNEYPESNDYGISNDQCDDTKAWIVG